MAPQRGDRLPVNIGIVLDRSGSMAGERKFVLAREAVHRIFAMLRPDDRCSLVVYDSEIDVLMPSSLATNDAKHAALAALDNIEPRGSTDLGGGWLRGCEQISEFLDDERVTRCLLLTDGLANRGITNRGELAHHAAELRRRGVSTSTFGVGADFDERLLRDMAHEGGGNFYFIEDAAQIPDILTSELGEALEVTLRDASLVVRSTGSEYVTTLNRFRSSRSDDGRDLRVELGDLSSGQQIDVVLEVLFKQRAIGETANVVVELHSAGEPVVDTESSVRWLYASHAENDAQPRNRVVDRAVAKLYAARARAEATEANRHRLYERARDVLESTARRIREYAGDDGELRDLAMALSAEVSVFAEAPLSVMELKASLFANDAVAKDRDSRGRARRI
jgi:Ca-activated chloride channel family protein